MPLIGFLGNRSRRSDAAILRRELGARHFWARHRWRKWQTSLEDEEQEEDEECGEEEEAEEEEEEKKISRFTVYFQERSARQREISSS